MEGADVAAASERVGTDCGDIQPDVNRVESGCTDEGIGVEGSHAIANNKNLQRVYRQRGVIAVAGHIVAHCIARIVVDMLHIVAPGEDAVGDLGKGGTDYERVERSAVAERPVAHGEDRIGDGEGMEAAAALKGHVADGGYRSTYLNCLQAAAALERAHANGEYRQRDFDARETTAGFEGAVLDSCHGGGNGDSGEPCAGVESIGTNGNNTIVGAAMIHGSRYLHDTGRFAESLII